ncbi:MAG: 3-deoxy-D-manno-octulosonic acid transferase [Candidatus Omnitrophota bacterium]|jgi:3-deoxy-D-manno-octulosonic-acid transferase
MFLLYDLVFIIFAIVYLPYFLLRKKVHQGFTQRLGFLPTALRLDRPVWIHAVSVGEAKVAGILAKQLRQAYPQKRFIFSTITTTGNRIVHSFKQPKDFLFYLPLDLSFITRMVITKLKPCVCIIVETEIWPNLIYQLSKMHVPTILVNARISDRSFLGYRVIKPLIKPLLNRLQLFCVQSLQDARRLSVLGVASDKLKITGNMKYDIIDFKRNDADYRLRLGLNKTDQLFVVGSTHPGEEEIILEVYKRLINEFPRLRLLIAPRHPERRPQIESLIEKLGFRVIRVSELSIPVAKNKDMPPGSAPAVNSCAKPVFLLDTIGELLSFYAIADIVFVGGSLINKGGHNILEPAYLSRPILFGPHMFNFRAMSDLFLSRQAARMVDGGEELCQTVRSLLNNPSELEAIGSRARQLVLENQGATKRNVELIKTFLKI